MPIKTTLFKASTRQPTTKLAISEKGKLYLTQGPHTIEFCSEEEFIHTMKVAAQGFQKGKAKKASKVIMPESV